ncbi:VOC family protein [Sphingobacterium mizutaii]|uniref:VOC family protein n=1 Tax=Sphingobacterium mizutaii TaxID=1010 RepID=UPI0016261E59|nr:VOC family protein [Sphingobacterium mizutaii]
MKLNNIRLMVRDFDSCFTFYKETLGLECAHGDVGEVYASFNIGIAGGLALFKSELMNMALGISAIENRRGSNDQFALILEVDDVDASFEDLKKKGIDFITVPMDMDDWGIRVAHFRDPESNLIEIYTELKG